MPPGHDTMCSSVPTPRLTEVQDMLSELDGDPTLARRREIAMLIKVYLERRGSRTSFHELLEGIHSSNAKVREDAKTILDAITEVRVEVTAPPDTASLTVEEPTPTWGEWLREWLKTQNPIVILIALGMMATVADRIAAHLGVDLGASEIVQEIPMEALTAPVEGEPPPDEGSPEEVP